ncbi:MAG TPA: D-Ala-D-Ala carboxypeptidase family metallohydrolase [Clostridiales bacterium]|nr:D-Ala-D-Ala carboxypeptidase family metallohydrolase [Clostridiales bacterium]
MSIKTAYISKLGKDYQISRNFALKEMQCKDGSDMVLYSSELLEKLEKLRAYGGFTVTINSGYRTVAYNKKIGGASNSQHLKGAAADIVVKKDGKIVNAKLICCLCQTLGFKGIGYISANAVHVDMRESGTYRGDERSDYRSNVGNDFYSYFKIALSVIEKLKIRTTAKEEDEMTQEQFDQMMENYLARLKVKTPSDWSKEERAWAEKNRLIIGDAEGNKQYKAYCTREQMVMLLYRLYQKIKGE